MPQTGAERQRAWRDRRVRHITSLEADRARLRAELADIRAQQCRHPAAAVDGGHCHACGTEMW